MPVVDEWSIALGLESTEIDKKLLAIEKRVGNIARTMGNIKFPKIPNLPNVPNSPASASGARKKTEAEIKAVQAKKVAVALAKEQARLSREATRAARARAQAERSVETILDKRDTQERRTIKILARIKRQLGENSEEYQKAVVDARRLNAAIEKASSRGSFRRLKKDVDQFDENLKGAVLRVRTMNRELSKQSFIARATGDSIRNLARSYISIFAIIAAGGAAFRVSKELDSVRATLVASSDSAEEAGNTFNFVAAESKRLGTDLTESARGYAKVAAAGKLTGLSNLEVKESFKAITEASTAFGLSSEESGGIFKAYTQILSKGKVSTEELLQIGERIPGALALAAKGAGKTSQEFFKLVESGQLMAKDFLPSFNRVLRQSVKENGALAAGMLTVQAAQNRMATAFQLNIDKMLSASLKGDLAGFFNTVSRNVDGSVDSFKVLGKTVGGILKGIGVVLDVLSPILNIVISSFGSLFGMFSSGGTRAVKGLNGEVVTLTGTFNSFTHNALEALELVILKLKVFQFFIRDLIRQDTVQGNFLVNFLGIGAALAGLSLVGKKLGVLKSIGGKEADASGKKGSGKAKLGGLAKGGIFSVLVGSLDLLTKALNNKTAAESAIEGWKLIFEQWGKIYDAGGGIINGALSSNKQAHLASMQRDLARGNLNSAVAAELVKAITDLKTTIGDKPVDTSTVVNIDTISGIESTVDLANGLQAAMLSQSGGL